MDSPNFVEEGSTALVTTAKTQTITCKITGLSADATATVTWKNGVGTTITDDDDFTPVEGTASETGIQVLHMDYKSVTHAYHICITHA